MISDLKKILYTRKTAIHRLNIQDEQLWYGQTNVMLLTTVSSRPLRSSWACSLFSFSKLITTEMSLLEEQRCFTNIFTHKIFHWLIPWADNIYDFLIWAADSQKLLQPLVLLLFLLFQLFIVRHELLLFKLKSLVHTDSRGLLNESNNFFLISSLIWSNTSQKQMY